MPTIVETLKPAVNSKYRWVICGLLFFATTINYLDRAVISLLKSYLERDFHWTESDYSNIVVAFQLTYAIGLLLIGRVIDRTGTKTGYAVSIFLWSIAAVGHAFVQTTGGFILARAALGVSEAGNFPAAIKAVAEWFPKKERALATGIFNAGTNVGAILAPLTVPLIAELWGWKMAFILTGSIGFLWIIVWYIYYEVPGRQKRLSQSELQYIQDEESTATGTAGSIPSQSNSQNENDSWLRLLGYRQTWAFILGKFLTDPVWWFYLFWLPAFLKAQYSLEGTAIALPVALVYTLAAVGSVAGGWLPLYFTNGGWTVFRARKTAMFIYACCAVPVVFASKLGQLGMWWAIFIIGVAAAAHQAWSANMYTTVSDKFPKEKVASVTGMGGMAGALGGMLIAKLAGMLFDHFKALGQLNTGYAIMFLICGIAYVIAWLIMHMLVPRPPRP
ncbi:MFS transporter [Flavihumibacter solisilvae]|uniref:MFS transporter n=1 Tax=Flavihumibacter solisilvae TaxID=1349421 RepID=UPI00068ADE62|nr:MFS transporter [Flavihumibacter solisilvae]